jgi:hypothetical protein
MISDVVAIALIFGVVTVLVVGMVVGIPIRTKLSPRGFQFESRGKGGSSEAPFGNGSEEAKPSGQ